jgi:hypothetical protein
MKTLGRQKVDVVNQTRSNPESFRGWRGQFTPEFVITDGIGAAVNRGRRPFLA